MVTKTELKKMFPTAKSNLVDAVVDNWSYAEETGRINSPARIWQFFANVGVETGGLTTIAENLNYSSAQRVYDVFKGSKSNPRFKSVKDAAPFVKNPQALGIKVYGGRMGNKPAPSTDGYDNRGSGMLQTTGADNMAAIGFAGRADVLRTDPVVAFKTAVDEWVKRGCNALADAGKTTELRRAINGGTNGLDDVKAYLVQAKKIWPASATVTKSKTAPIVAAENIYDGQVHEVVRTVQQRLDDLGYHEVGTVDGRWGGRTAGSITTFQGDAGLALDPKIDDKLLAALMAAKPRVIAPARANATVADLRAAGDKEVKQADQTKWAGWGGLAFAGFTGGSKALDEAKGTSETVRSIWDNVEPFQAFIMDNLWLILGAVGAFGIYKAIKIQRERLEKHQTGKDVSL